MARDASSRLAPLGEMLLLLLIVTRAVLVAARSSIPTAVAAVAVACAAVGAAAAGPDAPPRYAPLLRAARDRVGVGTAALLPLALVAAAPESRRMDAVRAAAVAVAFSLRASFERVAAAAAVGAALTGGRVVRTTAAASMPLVAHGLLVAAPGAFTLAEALLVASLIVEGAQVAATAGRDGLPSEVLPTVFSLAAATMIAVFVLPVAVHAPRKEVSRRVFVRLGVVVLLSYTCAVRAVGLAPEPISFVLRFAFQTQERLLLLIYWFVVLGVSMRFLVPMVACRCRRIVARKAYHILALVLFLPGVYVDPLFLSFAVSVALVLMLLAETARVGGLGRIGTAIDRATKSMRDERDRGPVVLTHMYLLIGNVLPLWFAMALAENPRGVLAVSGIVSLGVQDAVASICGALCGRTRWFSLGKTVEGTSAGILAAFAVAVTWGYVIGTVTESTSVVGIALASVAAGLFEAWTAQIDNLVLPLLYFAALEGFGIG
jgi:dolichol kinase